MPKENCELCEESGVLKVYNIVPQAVSIEAGIQRPKTVRLCSNCHQELGLWYSAKVGELTYDISVKQFVPKSPSQLAKEYETAYEWFTTYKKTQLSSRFPG